MTDQNTDYVRVPNRETRRLWAECRRRGHLQNGMTHALLLRRYKGNVRHVLGDGWYKDPTTRPLTYVETFAHIDSSEEQ